MVEPTSANDPRVGAQLVASVLEQEMRGDDTIIVFGEDVGALGGVFGATRRLQREFGRDRVFDTPISGCTLTRDILFICVEICLEISSRTIENKVN